MEEDSGSKIESIVTNVDDKAKLATSKLMEKLSPKRGKRPATVSTSYACEYWSVGAYRYS